MESQVNKIRPPLGDWTGQSVIPGTRRMWVDPWSGCLQEATRRERDVSLSLTHSLSLPLFLKSVNILLGEALKKSKQDQANTGWGKSMFTVVM